MPDLARQARERFALREAATFGPTADQAAEENLLVRHHVLYNYLTIKTIDFSSSSSSAYIWGRESPGHALDNMRGRAGFVFSVCGPPPTRSDLVLTP